MKLSIHPILNTRRLAIVLCSLTLMACGGTYYEEESYSYEDDYSHSYDEPELYQFHVIDTYETNTEFDNETHLALSPYINTGEFEIYWNADSDDDYFVEFYFNTSPNPIGGELISTEWCGPYEYCHDHQYQFCEYTPSLYLSCESSSGDYHSSYIGNRLTEVPQDAYLILQVCDSQFYYCEYEARQVSME